MERKTIEGRLNNGVLGFKGLFQNLKPKKKVTTAVVAVIKKKKIY